MTPGQNPGDPRVPLDKRQAEAQAQHLEESVKARKVFERLGSTEDGLQVLRFIYELTGMRRSPIVINRQASEISEKLSLVIAGRQEVWRDLRPYISNELFVKIECPEPITAEARK